MLYQTDPKLLQRMERQCALREAAVNTTPPQASKKRRGFTNRERIVGHFKDFGQLTVDECMILMESDDGDGLSKTNSVAPVISMLLKNGELRIVGHKQNRAGNFTKIYELT